MKQAIVLSALMLSLAAGAAEVKTNFVDHSSGVLLDAAAAKSVMQENIPNRVWKLFPANKYAFVSQVEGGMKGSTCVVSARVMLVPVTPTMKAVLFRPEKTATAYDAAPNSSLDACRTMARDKLKEATQGVVSALVKM